ncbi:MAG: diaminopimelate epimerase [Armatimonadota bacterium]
MRFAKMHGAGNDYIYVNAVGQDLAGYDLCKLARAVSDRHFGIGSDGLILIETAKAADFRMRMFNSDGSEAEMCGNGMRCFAKYVYERGLTTERNLEVETGAGLIKTKLVFEGKRVVGARVDMGRPRLAPDQIPVRLKGHTTSEPVVAETLRADGKKLAVTCVSMGNPHCVLFVKNPDTYPVARLGPAIETHPAFPARTNVEFVQVLGHDRAKMRVWERGAGETLACGTGACAAAVACNLTEQTGRSVTMALPGGELHIEWAGNDHVFLSGPAEEAFSGDFDAEALIASLEERVGG